MFVGECVLEIILLLLKYLLKVVILFSFYVDMVGGGFVKCFGVIDLLVLVVMVIEDSDNYGVVILLVV